MTKSTSAYRYNYQVLDEFLIHDYDPMTLSNRLDWIRDRLVALVEKDEFYREHIVEDTYLIVFFRDLFKNLEKMDHGNR